MRDSITGPTVGNLAWAGTADARQTEIDYNGTVPDRHLTLTSIKPD